MSEENNAAAPQGKGMAVTGFILALVGLLLAGVVIGGVYLATGSKVVAYIWIVLCIVSVILSGMGMSKLGKTGGKKGLGIAGLIIGIIAVVYSVFVLLGLSVMDAGLDDLTNTLNEIESMQ